MASAALTCLGAQAVRTPPPASPRRGGRRSSPCCLGGNGFVSATRFPRWLSRLDGQCVSLLSRQNSTSHFASWPSVIVGTRGDDPMQAKALVYTQALHTIQVLPASVPPDDGDPNQRPKLLQVSSASGPVHEICVWDCSCQRSTEEDRRPFPLSCGASAAIQAAALLFSGQR